MFGTWSVCPVRVIPNAIEGQAVPKPTKPKNAKPAKAAARPGKTVKSGSAKPAPKASVKPTKPTAVAAKAPKGVEKKGAKPSVPPVKKAEAAKPGAKSVAPAKGTPAPAAANGEAKKPPKGITVVTPKPLKKPKPKKLEMPVSEPLLKPGIKWKPLIASGPKAPPSSGIPGVALQAEEAPVETKSRMAKKELDRYKEILLQKRAELLGDIANMEDEALRQNSGSLSNLPQHMAEQGSEAFDQQLSLGLAEVDRNLIREIDAALKRIADGTYGVCERTGQKISAERLAELPWTRYSIEAAREMERRPYSE